MDHKILSYNKTNWIEKETVIDAEKMNNIETGIEEAFEELNDNDKAISILHNKVDVENVSQAIQEAVKNANKSVDIIENNVIQDGLIECEKTFINKQSKNIVINSKDDLFLDIYFENISSLETGKMLIEGKGNVFSLRPQITGDQVYFTSYAFNYNGVVTTKSININDLKSIKLHFVDDKIKLYMNGELIYTALLKEGVVKPAVTNVVIAEGTESIFVANVMTYNRKLTQQEILHNLSILDSTPSINKINDYAFSTTADYVQDRTGRTQEEINKTFYKRFCKEFTSNGESITIKNGLDGYLFGARLEGQTVKNLIFNNHLENGDDGWTWLGGEKSINENVCKLVATNNKDNRIMSPLSVTTCSETSKDKFYASVECKVTDYSGGEIISYVSLENRLWASKIQEIDTTSSSFKRYSKVLTAQDAWLGRKIRIYVGSLTETNATYEIKNPILINLTEMFGAGKEPTKEQCDEIFQSHLPFGLSSTKATLTNNGSKYSFYDPIVKGKTRVMKALKGTDEWIEIDVNETRDTIKYTYKLESINSDFGSISDSAYDYIDKIRKVKVINTKEMVLDGSEDLTVYGKRTDVNIFKISVPNIIDERSLKAISNNFKPLDVISGTVNEEGICIYSRHICIAISTTKVPNFTSSAIKEYFAQQKENGAPITIRYQLETPIEIPMTDEEIAKYDSYKQIIELNNFGNVCDTLEILEDGSGVYTKKIAHSIIPKEYTWAKASVYGTKWRTVSTTLTPYAKSSCKFATTIPLEVAFLYTNYMYIMVTPEEIGVPIDGDAELATQKINEIMQKQDYEVAYEMTTPTFTYIPKELMPQIIQTYETNNFTFGDEIKPSKASVAIPVNISNILTESFEKEIAKLEYEQIMNEV